MTICLEEADVLISHHHYDDMIHGFLGLLSELVSLERAHAAYDAAVSDLRDALE